MLIRHLAEIGKVEVTPTWTTRQPRGVVDEHAIEHFFLTEDDFDRAEREGLFLATATMFGLKDRYGCPKLRRPRPGAIAAVILRPENMERLYGYYANPVIYLILRKATDRSGRKDREERGEVGAYRTFRNDGPPEQLFAAVEAALEVDFPSC